MALRLFTRLGPVALGCLALVALVQAGPEGGVQPPDPWVSPPVLQNTSAKPGVVELTLIAAPTKLELLPGKPTEAWAYNGSVPGPTLELREGDFVTVHFTNKLA